MIPYGRQCLDEGDRSAVQRVLESDYLTTGPEVEAFEEELAAVTAAPEAVACSSGTAALHLAALALGVGPGDAVIVPAMTFAATANAVRLTGAEVRLADVDPETGLMRPADLEAAVADAEGAGRLRAVFAVHLNGQCADIEGLSTLARRHGLALVVDAAHALGAACATGGGLVPVGAGHLADLTTFSFHPVKTVTTAEGGAVTTADARLAERLRRFRNHGMERDPARFQIPEEAIGVDGRALPWYYEVQEVGLNYRLSDLQAALGRSQLARLHGFVARRAELVATYEVALERLAPVVRPPARSGGRPAWHLFAPRIDFGATVPREVVMRRLTEAGIGSQVHYIPLHRQPAYRRHQGARTLPGADAYYARCLSLPLYPCLEDTAPGQVVAALANALELER
jgi:UDP-4-amino-4,6-dideoxy-N-acetyl-beta-L-altrosamine transaminase